MVNKVLLLTWLILMATGSAIGWVAPLPQGCQLTPADMEGPYYIPNAPVTTSLFASDADGQKLVIAGRVYDQNCTPLAGATVEVWQADARGEYDFSDQFIGRGQVVTDANGRYWFWTILPARYEPRPPHIHFRVSHPQAQTLITQVYFAGNDNGGVPPAQIIAPTLRGSALRGRFDIVLARN